ncbi:MAG: dephospho-CoA kinase [Myxococcales bacterium]|nr:dephospho-CoA kinase [Myxococcales bacterium]
MKVVGLTGGIATGKSTVGRVLAEHGVPVVDADVTARQVVEPGSDALAAIVEAFGPEVLDQTGALDRRSMRSRIAHDPEARRTLEGITHPAIRQAITAELSSLAQAGHSAAVVEAALMVETGSYRLYDALVVVRCDPETQVARVVARDGSTEAQARSLIATQLPMEQKVAVADHVITNDGSLQELRARVLEVWAELA